MRMATLCSAVVASSGRPKCRDDDDVHAYIGLRGNKTKLDSTSEEVDSTDQRCPAASKGVAM